MRTSIRRGLVLTALAGSCVMAVMPAALAQATTSPEAIAADATGPVSLGPIADATTPPSPHTVTAVGVTLPGVLVIGSTGTNALTDTVTDPSTTQNTATSAVDNLTSSLLIPTLGGLITGTAVSTSCTYNSANTPAVVASTTITSLNVLGTSINLTGLTSPNDNIIGQLPGATTTLLGTLGITLGVTLNQQTTNANGSTTVNGIAISLGDPALLGNGTENIFIASSTCGPLSTVVASPVASGKGLGIGLGLLGLVGAGFGAVWVRRRSSFQAA